MENKMYNLMSWIFEYCYDITDYVNALGWCGFTEKEIADELVECGLSTEDEKEVAIILKKKI